MRGQRETWKGGGGGMRSRTLPLTLSPFCPNSALSCTACCKKLRKWSAGEAPVHLACVVRLQLPGVLSRRCELFLGANPSRVMHLACIVGLVEDTTWSCSRVHRFVLGGFVDLTLERFRVKTTTAVPLNHVSV